MIAVDTKVLLRFIADDDPAQSRLAHELLTGLTETSPGFVSREVVLELSWTLRRTYKLSRDAMAEVMLALYQADGLVFEEDAALLTALELYSRGGPDLADILIARAARRSGASELVTFDLRAASLEGVRLLEA